MKTGAKYGLVLGHVRLSDSSQGCNHPWVPAVVDAFTNPFAIMVFARNKYPALFKQFEHFYKEWFMHGLVRSAISRAEQGSVRADALRCSYAHVVSKLWRRRLQSSSKADKKGMEIQTFQSPLILLAVGCCVAALVFGLELLYRLRRKRNDRHERKLKRRAISRKNFARNP